MCVCESRYFPLFALLGACPKDKLGGLRQKGHSTNKGGDDGGGALIVRMGWRPDGLSVRLPLLSSTTTKCRRWRAVMEEVNKWCSEFCISVGAATRTAGILIHSRLKALAVDLSRPSGRLWLYGGIIGLIHAFSSHMPLLMAASTFRLGKSCESLLQWCYTVFVRYR